jgi:hypothetical protein
MVSKRGWGLLLAVFGVATIGLGIRRFKSEDDATKRSVEPPSAWQPLARPYPAVNEDDSGDAGAQAAEALAKEVATTIQTWRTAIHQKDADTVMRLDLTFRDAPDRYLAALVDSARSDPDDRVRAFSTRALGKLGRTDVAPQLGELLADANPYVRQNAAWALGELGNVPGGRATARSTLPALKRAEARDPAGAVRAAARSALAKLE